MAQYDTPPSIDPKTGRIPPYRQVLSQDSTTGNYTIKYEYTKSSQLAPITSATTGLTTAQTTFPTYGSATAQTPSTPEIEDPVVETPMVPVNPTVDSGGGGRDRDTFGADPFAPKEATVSDLSKIVNPNQVTQTVLGGVVTLAPSALGALIALGNANQQRSAVSELNRRAEAGTLGVNPDGTTVTNSEFSSLADSIYGTDQKFGIFGFREQLSPTVNSAIKASKFFGNTNQLTGEPSTSVANQLRNPQSFEQLMREFEAEQQREQDPFDRAITQDFISSLPDTPSRVRAKAPTIREVSGDVTTSYGDAQTGTQKREIEDKEEVKELRDQVAKQKAETARVVDLTNAVSNKARSNEVQDKNGNAVTYTDRRTGEKKAVNFGQGGGGRRNGGGGGGQGGGGSGGGSGGRCFVKGTMIEMANGNTKEITTIIPGMETKGGTVEFVLQGLPVEIWDYKGVKVSGSHWVVENNQLIAVEDSEHGIKTDMVEPVYSMKTSKQRIWIGGIEFGDFESGTDEDWEPYFEKVKQDLNKKLRGEI